MKAFAAAVVILLLGLAMPTVPLPRTVYDYIVVFDISQSMNVEDYQLDGARISRLDYARGRAKKLEVRVLITWEQRWYVIHLSEFH